VGLRSHFCSAGAPAPKRRGAGGRTAVAASPGAAMPGTEEELKALRVRELKRALGLAGLDVSGCFDKESLFELLQPEGVTDRVLASLAAAAEAATPKACGVPLIVEQDTYLALDLKLGLSSVVARFMIDISTPFTTITNSMAQSLGGTLVQGTNPPQVTLGSAYLGELDCGEFRAVPVMMALPPDCCGVLSLDFLSRFDWEFDIQKCYAKIAKVPGDKAVAVPFDVGELRKVPVEFKSAKNMSMGGMEIKLLKTPLKLGRQGALAADMLLGTLGAFSVACEAYILFASVSACSAEAAKALALGGEDYPGQGKQIKTPGGKVQTFQDYSLSLAIGDGPEGPVAVNAQVCVDHPGLQKIGFTGGTPTAILGLDILGRSRIVFSPREMCLWLSLDLG